MLHQMKLYHEAFISIKEFKKSIELRLNDEKRRNIYAGDIIEFKDIKTNEIISTQVINIYYFKSFKDLYSYFKDHRLLGYENKNEGSYLDMNKIYNEANINKYGVVGIEILPIDTSLPNDFLNLNKFSKTINYLKSITNNQIYNLKNIDTFTICNNTIKYKFSSNDKIIKFNKIIINPYCFYNDYLSLLFNLSQDDIVNIFNNKLIMLKNKKNNKLKFIKEELFNLEKDKLVKNYHIFSNIEIFQELSNNYSFEEELNIVNKEKCIKNDYRLNYKAALLNSFIKNNIEINDIFLHYLPMPKDVIENMNIKNLDYISLTYLKIISFNDDKKTIELQNEVNYLYNNYLF